MTSCRGGAKENDVDGLHFANGVVSLLGASVVSCVVLHPNIHEGLAAKVGLILMALSMLATAALTLTETENWGGLWAAGLVMRVGVVIVCGSILWKAHVFLRSNIRVRRSADWRDILTGR
jgi:hypothetical protein